MANKKTVDDIKKDKEQLIKALEKELEAARKDLQFVENKLNNPSFMAKAPEAVVAQQREAQAKHLAKIAMLEESLKKLK